MKFLTDQRGEIGKREFLMAGIALFLVLGVIIPFLLNRKIKTNEEKTLGIIQQLMAGETQFVMFKDIQYHPVTDDVIHVDLMRVRRDEKMTITVSIRLEGDAEGVKQGGVLSQIMNSIDIECFPTDVPEFISLDISDLVVNSSKSVADLIVDSKLTILAEGDQVVTTCHPPREEEEIEVEVKEGEEVEGEAAAEEGEEKAESDAGSEESTE